MAIVVAAVGLAATPGRDVRAADSGGRSTVVSEPVIERAVAGVSLFISENAASIATGITAPCPLMTSDQLGWFMGQQTLAPRLDGWAVELFMYDGVGSGAPGIACGVDIQAHVGQAGSGAPHGVRLEAVVVPDGATLGDLLGVVQGGVVIGPGAAEIGGEVGGTCYPGVYAVCVLMWTRAGLAITTVLAGPHADVTQEQTVTLMSSMIPTMVQGLADYASTAAPPSTTVPPSSAPATTPAITLDLAGARATVAEFIAANPVGTTGPIGVDGLVCPSISAAGVGDVMSAAGLAPAVDPFAVTVRSSAIAPGLVTVSCGGDVIDALVQATAGTVPTYTPSVTVYDITGVATIDHVLAERPGLVLLQSNVAAIGGDLYGSPCDVASGSGTFCVRVWHREGFVVMFEVSGNARAEFDAAATQAITTLAPAVVGNLATRAIWPVPASGLG